MHVSQPVVSNNGSKRPWSWHNSLFSLIILHASQYLWQIDLGDELIVRRRLISLTTSPISIRLSRFRVLPLILLRYWLTAGWVIPSRLAISSCFILYDSLRSFAIIARIVGTTVLDAISQGMIMLEHQHLWYNQIVHYLCYIFICFATNIPRLEWMLKYWDSWIHPPILFLYLNISVSGKMTADMNHKYS